MSTETKPVHYLREVSPHRYVATANLSDATHLMDGAGPIVPLNPAKPAATQPTKPAPSPMPPQPKITDEDRKRYRWALETLETAADIAKAEGAWKAGWVLSDLIHLSDYAGKTVVRQTMMQFVTQVEDAAAFADGQTEHLPDRLWADVFVAAMLSKCYKRGMAPNWLWKEDPAGVLFDKSPGVKK